MRPAATPSLLLSCLCRGRLHLLFLLLLLIINSLLRLQWPGHLIVIVIVIVELVVVALGFLVSGDSSCFLRNPVERSPLPHG